MSILIRGMKMPENCHECEFVDILPTCPCNKMADDDFWNNVSLAVEGHKDCPLLEVPPHGDLIDRRELMKTLEIAEECENCESHVGIHCAKESFVDACEAICDAPTIIGEEGAP